MCSDTAPNRTLVEIAPGLGSGWVLLPGRPDTPEQACQCSWGFLHPAARPLLHRRTRYCVPLEVSLTWLGELEAVVTKSWEKVRNELLFRTAAIARTLAGFPLYAAYDGLVQCNGSCQMLRHRYRYLRGEWAIVFHSYSLAAWTGVEGGDGSWLESYPSVRIMSNVIWACWTPRPNTGKKL